MRARSKQGEAVHALLARSDGPLSANEIWRALDATGIGLATIYRVLKRGVEAGELVTASLPGGQTRYEPVGREHHHHFICSKCERAYDISGCVSGLEDLLPPSFAMTGHEIVLFGSCAACRES